MLLDSVFTNFLRQKPFCVMARAALERMLSVSRLDALFREVASVQYERDLLFSGLVDLIARVVTRVDRSVLKAYESLKEVLGVSDEAVYQKLRGIETCVSQALVRDSSREASVVLTKLGVAETSWVPGRRIKILDGNHLQASEHRIAELRAIWDAPGTALVVWDQPTRLIGDVFLTEDGHAQERSLLGDVLETVAEDELWIADRNFCTLGFLFGLWARKARFVIRQHGSLRAAHGDEAVEELSGDSLAYELRNTYEGMMVAIEPEHWTVFSEMSLTQFAKMLLKLAKTLDLSRYRKHRRGPKKPATPRTQYHNGGHASTAKILALRKPK